jgi:hypothetical protein
MISGALCAIRLLRFETGFEQAAHSRGATRDTAHISEVLNLLEKLGIYRNADDLSADRLCNHASIMWCTEALVNMQTM